MPLISSFSTLRLTAHQLGRLWGKYCLAHAHRYYHSRATKFALNGVVIDAHRLEHLRGRPFVVVANHIIPAAGSLSPAWRPKKIPSYHQSADAYVLQRTVREENSQALHVVGKCDLGYWYSRPWMRWLQEQNQPFFRAEFEALPNLIALERNPGVCHRRFLGAVENVVALGHPIVIFPGGIDLDEEGTYVARISEHGASHIARQHDLIVLPACILGTESWRPGTRVTVAFGEPIVAVSAALPALTATMVWSICDLRNTNSAAHRSFAQEADLDRHCAESEFGLACL